MKRLNSLMEIPWSDHPIDKTSSKLYNMKYLALVPLLLLQTLLNAQNKSDKLTGKYEDYFGSTIEIKPDSTFRYSRSFDMSGSWSKGIWHTRNDTIYFKTILVYDTLRYKNSYGKIVDSLFLSWDDKPEVVFTTLWNGGLPSGGQNYMPCPNRLFYKNEKLFRIGKNGKLIRKKIRGTLNRNKRHLWFIKLPPGTE